MAIEERVDEEELGDSDTDADTETPTPAHSDATEGEEEVTGEAKSKKKKNKKKKKKKKPPASEQKVAAAQPSAATKQEQDARFATALEQLQRGSADSVWVALESCNIFDAKTRKVAEALRNNKEITALDMSRNSIGDSGAQALAEALQSGAAPELVFLDLRANSFGDEATAKLEIVQTQRRRLSIQLGAFAEAVIEPLERPSDAADPDAKDALAVNMPTSAWDMEEKPANGFLERFFQVGNGAHSLDTAETPSTPVEDPEKLSQEVFEEVESLLAEKAPSVPALSNALRQCLAGLCKEMETSSVPLLRNTKLAELRPFARRAVLSLAALGRTLDVPAASHTTPFSKSKPLAGAGSHRTTVAQIVERLTYGRLATINTHLVHAGLLPRLFALCFACPNNNALHAACSGALRWTLESGLFLLWKPLLGPGMGVADPWCPQGRSLPDLVISALEAARTAETCALRACNVGFAINVASQLHDASQDNDMLGSSLSDVPGWPAFAADGGPLAALRAEQDGDLCGPRPSRPRTLAMMDSHNAQEQLAGGGGGGMGGGGGGSIGGSSDDDSPSLISSDDLVKLLTQSVHGIHVSDDGDGDGGDSDEELFGGGSSDDDDLQRLIDSPVEELD